MAVEALILLRTKPGRSKQVVSEIAKGKNESSRDHDYLLDEIKIVYRATGKYDIIVHVEADDLDGIFRIANQIASPGGSRDMASNPGGQSSSSSSSSGQSGGSGGTNISESEVIVLCPKPANDP